MKRIDAFFLLAVAGATFGSTTAASAACGTVVQAPSVWIGSYGSGGPHVDACGSGSCNTVASTPARSVPGVAVGSASIHNCLK
jgi:hypothetical protein